MLKSLPWQKIFFIFVTIASAIALASFGYVGIYSRFKADDFATAATLHEMGFWKAQLHWYTQWSGRYAFTFLVSLVQSTGRANWLPPVILLVWGSAASWAIAELLTYTKIAQRWWIAIASGLILVLGAILSTDRLSQSFYWLTGSLTYIAPLIFWLLIVAVIARAMHASAKRFPASYLIAAGVLSFVAGGFSEAATAAQITMLILAVIFVQFKTRGTFRLKLQSLLTCSLIASLVSLIVVAQAPGNAVRASLFPSRPDLLLVGKFAGIFTGYILQDRFLLYLGPVLLILLFFFTLGIFQSGRREEEKVKEWRFLLIGLPIALVITIFACFVPSIYIVRIPLPPRALIIPGFVFIGLLTAWSYVLGRAAGLFLRWASLRKYLPGTTAVLVSCTIIVLLFVGGATLIDNGRELPGARTSAREFAVIEKSIGEQKAAGKEDVVVGHITVNNPFDIGTYGTLGVTPDPNNDYNKAMARFYQVKTVTGK